MARVVPARIARFLVALLPLACATGRPDLETCPPVGAIADEGETPVSIRPGDYRVMAFSTGGRRAEGTLRLWRSSPADSGRAPHQERWVRVAAGDTLRHPLIGVTDIDFLVTRADPDIDVASTDRPPNPVYPQVLVYRSRADGELDILVDTVVTRDPDVVSLDGGGSGLSVEWRGDVALGGSYAPYGILTTEHAEGRWCARLLRRRVDERTASLGR